MTLSARVGKMIQAIRQQKPMSQKALAERLGVSRTVLSKIENGEASIDIDRFIVLARALDCNPEKLLRAARTGSVPNPHTV